MTDESIDKKREEENVKGILGCGIVLLVAGCCGLTSCSGLLGHLDRETHVARVTSKERVDGTYMIYTKTDEGEVRVFENRDSSIEFKWDSSNIYGEIEPGKTYEIKTYGFRLPFLSWYENITSVREVKSNPELEK